MKSYLAILLTLLTTISHLQAAHYKVYQAPSKVPLTDSTYLDEDHKNRTGSHVQDNFKDQRIDPIVPAHHAKEQDNELNHMDVDTYLKNVEDSLDSNETQNHHGSAHVEHDDLLNHDDPEVQHEEDVENEKMRTDQDLKVDHFMKALHDMECDNDSDDEDMDENGNYSDMDLHDEYQTLCGSVLKRLALHPLGNYDFNHHDFYKYLNEKIYMPLAYKMNKRDSMAGLLQDLIFLDKDNSLFNGRPLMTNYPVFEKSIMSMYEDVAAKTNDLDANQQYISESIISILKRFHLYWNSLRYTNQIDKVKVDTKEILQNILQNYEIKRKFLAEVTRTLVTKIKDAYFRFLRAHRMLEILNTSGANIIVFQLLRRYKDVVDNIRLNKASNPKLVHEISLMMELVKSFHIINYKLKKSEPESITMFNSQILIRLENVYKILKTQLGEDIRWKAIKDFSATLILKLMHRTFVIFKVNTISQVVNKPLMSYEAGYELNTKVFYQLLDNMMLIPRTCANFLVLKSCAHHEALKVLRYLSGRYKLKRSTTGWVIYDDIAAAVKLIFSKANNLVWNNFNTFKMYYYQNLFAVLYNLKLRFFIKNMDEVEDLENAIGDLIEKTKTESANNQGKVNLNLIEKLDQDIYNKFLTIKAKYNRFSPVRKDVQVLAMIKRDIKKFLQNFMETNATEITPKFQQMVGHINALVKSWVIETANKPEVAVQVNNLREGMPMVYPVIEHVMDSSMPDTKKMGTDIPGSMDKLQMHSVEDMENSLHHMHDDEHEISASSESADLHNSGTQNDGFVANDSSILNEANSQIHDNMGDHEDDISNKSPSDVSELDNKGVVQQHDSYIEEGDPDSGFIEEGD